MPTCYAVPLLYIHFTIARYKANDTTRANNNHRNALFNSHSFYGANSSMRQTQQAKTTLS